MKYDEITVNSKTEGTVYISLTNYAQLPAGKAWSSGHKAIYGNFPNTVSFYHVFLILRCSCESCFP